MHPNNNKGNFDNISILFSMVFRKSKKFSIYLKTFSSVWKESKMFSIWPWTVVGESIIGVGTTLDCCRGVDNGFGWASSWLVRPCMSNICHFGVNHVMWSRFHGCQAAKSSDNRHQGHAQCMYTNTCAYVHLWHLTAVSMADQPEPEPPRGGARPAAAALAPALAKRKRKTPAKPGKSGTLWRTLRDRKKNWWILISIEKKTIQIPFIFHFLEIPQIHL